MSNSAVDVQNNPVGSDYVIPAMGPLKVGRVGLVFPLFAVIGYGIGLSVGGTLTGSLSAALGGLIFAVPAFVVTQLVTGFVEAKRQAKVRGAHSFAWYRETFAAHTHANGHVSCRHCGSHKTNVRNLMGGTYMRAHSCSQCGETLYFSPEKV